jgi:hypothetical protein
MRVDTCGSPATWDRVPIHPSAEPGLYPEGALAGQNSGVASASAARARLFEPAAACGYSGVRPVFDGEDSAIKEGTYGDSGRG